MRAMVWKLQNAHKTFLHPFLVNPSSGASLAYLDGLRALAVLLVVVFHVWALSGTPVLLARLPLAGLQLTFTPLVASGFIGVQLFFVLSGFLLAQYWLKPHFQGKAWPSTLQYFRQRLFRIVPAYYCCLFLVLLFCVPALIPPQLVYSKIGIFTLAAHLFFLQYLFPVSATSYTIEGAFWTLTMEMLFYCLLPLVIRCFLKKRWKYSLFASMLVSLSWLYLTRHSLGPLVQLVQYHTPGVILSERDARYFLATQFPAHAANFALGISLANIYVQFQFKLRKDRLFHLLTGKRAGLVYLISGAGLECFLIYGVFQKPNPAWAYYSHDLLDALGFTLILAGILFGGPMIRTAFSFFPLRFLGIISYSVYLWHLPLIHLFTSYPNLAALNPQTRFSLVLYATWGAVLLLAAGFYLAVEKPFMLIGRQRHLVKTASIKLPKEAISALAAGNITLFPANALPEQAETRSLEALHLEP